MRMITAGQLRARLGEVLDEASAGGRIIIERDRVPLAAVVPIEDVHRLEGQTEEALQRKLAAIERIDDLARRMRQEATEPDPRFPDAASWIRWDRDHGHEDGA